ncbi:MAG TPA: hypothetical protein VIL86_05960 [Tepidisphaeraceae bacterium]|jgi:ELWxxDGT repeat protein
MSRQINDGRTTQATRFSIEPLEQRLYFFSLQNPIAPPPAPPPPPSPGNVTQVGDMTFFTDWSPEAGEELWVSDGTLPGTHLVKDIVPGPADSHPNGLAEYNGSLLFFADGQMWKSDGTDAGTVIVPLAQPALIVGSKPVRFGDHLYYFDEAAERIWKTDGTPEGTVLYTQSLPAGVQPGSDLIPWGEVNGALYYVCASFNGTAGSGYVFRNDSSQTVSQRMGVLNTPGQTVNYKGGLYRASYSTSNVVYLTQLDESAPNAFKTISSFTSDPTYPSETAPLILVSGDWMFLAIRRKDGWELWKSDGTAAGTSLIQTFSSALPDAISDSPLQLADAGGRLFFTSIIYGRSTRPVGGPFDWRVPQIWCTDGTSSGTVLLHEEKDAPSNSPAAYRDLTAVGDRAYFSYRNSIWTSDGTAQNTVSVEDGASGMISAAGGAAWYLSVAQDQLVRYSPETGAWPSATAGLSQTLRQDQHLIIDNYTSHPNDLTYRWDLNGDGIFDEARGSSLFIPTPVMLWSMPPGEYTVRLQAQNSMGETRISRPAVITIQPPAPLDPNAPDLVGTLTRIGPAKVRSGGKGKALLRVTNVGNGTVQSNYISGDLYASLTPDGPPVEHVTIGDFSRKAVLKQGQSTTLRLNFNYENLRSESSTNRYFIRAWILSDETNVSNNAAAGFWVTVQPQLDDVRVVAVQQPALVPAHGKGKFQFTLRNDGSMPSVGRAYVSLGGKIDAGHGYDFLDQAFFINLKPGASKVYTLPLSAVFDGILQGSYPSILEFGPSTGLLGGETKLQRLPVEITVT